MDCKPRFIVLMDVEQDLVVITTPDQEKKAIQKWFGGNLEGVSRELTSAEAVAVDGHVTYPLESETNH